MDQENMPEVREIMFDDDTFTDFKPRVEEIARGLGEIGLPWSCNAKANVPYNTLKIMKENGLRLLLVGYESGDDQILLNIKKGLRTDIARRFTELPQARHPDPRHVHPGPARRDARHDREDDRVRQGNQSTHDSGLAGRAVSGTTLYKQAVDNGWLEENKVIHLVNDSGVQLAAISYPHLSREEIYHGVETFYKRFYFRPSKIWEIVREMAGSWNMTKRRLREGVSSSASSARTRPDPHDPRPVADRHRR
jgi:hypothetical protein